MIDLKAIRELRDDPRLRAPDAMMRALIYIEDTGKLLAEVERKASELADARLRLERAEQEALRLRAERDETLSYLAEFVDIPEVACPNALRCDCYDRRCVKLYGFLARFGIASDPK